MNYKIATILSAKSFSQGRGASQVMPVEEMSVPDIFQYLHDHPNDGFMFIYLDVLIAKSPDAVVEEALSRFQIKPDSVNLGVLLQTPDGRYPQVKEALNGYKEPQKLLELFSAHHNIDVREMLVHEYHLVQQMWDKIFRDNRENHKPLSGSFTFGIPANFIDAIRNPRQYTHVNDLVTDTQPHSITTGTSLRTVQVEQTMERVNELPLDDILVGDIIGFGFCGTYMTLVNWKLNLSVPFGRNMYSITGVSQSSGKGIDKMAAAASGIMEALERYSAGLGCTPNFPDGFEHPPVFIKASYEKLRAEGALDPNSLSLEIPYMGHELHWVKGEALTQSGSQEIWIPAQAVYLLPNLDEVSVCVSSSNGLASGNTLSEAKLHALLEIIERDGDYTIFYTPDRVFTLTAEDPKISDILNRYKSRGLTVQVLDLTSEFGVPTYRAFVQTEGQIISGSGTHLDGRIAMARAICELSPKCFVWEKKGGDWHRVINPAEGTPTRVYNQLPNYSSGNVAADLRTMESLLIRNGYSPIYVDLTRSDIHIPVVRAIVPGLDMPMGPSERQIYHFLEQSGMKEQVLKVVARS